jgi:sigma-54 dependent transcriptional regulator, flagellar regulatory protein
MPAEARMPTGHSAPIRAVCRLIRQVAVHDSSVLILGESGTGKEVVARAIHDSSPRRSRPFVAINCGAIPEELLESELFGHEKGSFTGAVSARRGRFELADGGTLLLDEVGDMSLPMQVKLLRVLQERSFERVGGHLPIRANVRIIAATHRDLDDAVLRGTFRGDLYYRLNVFPIETPALRARIDDLPLLIEDFVAQNAAAGRGRLSFTAAAFKTLAQYAFPGNVRELGNLIERLSILCPERPVDLADLPARYRANAPAAGACEAESTAEPDAAASRIIFVHPPSAAPDGAAIVAAPVAADPAAQTSAPLPLPLADQADDVLDDEQALSLLEPGSVNGTSRLPHEGFDLRLHLFAIERDLISQALQRSGGTVAHAARLLNLRRTTLVEKLRKLGIAAA